MPPARPDRHCQHCWGNCQGDCLLDEGGLCLHNVHSVILAQQRRARRPLSRGWWRMLFHRSR